MKYERGYIKYTVNGISDEIHNTIFQKNKESEFLTVVFSGKNKLKQICHVIEHEDNETETSWEETIFTLFAN